MEGDGGDVEFPLLTAAVEGFDVLQDVVWNKVFQSYGEDVCGCYLV